MATRGNVAVAVNGDSLTITVDLRKSLGPSSTGKSEFVAGTGGFQSVPGPVEGLVFSLNVIKPR